MSESALARLRQWVRHHISSVVATGVDFAVMIGLVELLAFTPVMGTVVGAAVGGATNFLMGRHYTYRSQSEQVGSQVLRYVWVSGASLGLNALGEHFILSLLAPHYVLGRVLVATAVNNAWNYPMHRGYVFVQRKPAKENPA
ncbi:MAG TPA: GtrA family protein [Polyangia bacterium]